MALKLDGHSFKEEPSNIQSLPQEVLLHIFSYLSVREFCNTVSNVCKQWECLHWDSQLYTLPEMFKCERTRKNLFDTCLKVASHLDSPCFGKVYTLKIIKKCLKIHNKVKRDKTYVGLCKSAYVLYQEFVVMLSHLRVVNLIHTSIDSCSKALSHLLICCIQLEELKVFKNVSFRIGNADLIALCDHLCGTLRVLQLDCEVGWTLEGVNAITKCRRLQDLAILKAHDLSPECLLAVSNMSSLRRLKIQSYYERSMNTWISMLSNDALKGLVLLHLDDIRFNDKMAVAIGTNLKNLTDLYIMPRVLCYKTDFVACEGLERIIKGCSKLRSLGVVCGGNEPIVNTILLIPKYIAGLKKLYVSCLQLTSLNWKQTLNKNMPDLIICEHFTRLEEF